MERNCKVHVRRIYMKIIIVFFYFLTEDAQITFRPHWKFA